MYHSIEDAKQNLDGIVALAITKLNNVNQNGVSHANRLFEKNCFIDFEIPLDPNLVNSDPKSVQSLGKEFLVSLNNKLTSTLKERVNLSTGTVIIRNGKCIIPIRYKLKNPLSLLDCTTAFIKKNNNHPKLSDMETRLPQTLHSLFSIGEKFINNKRKVNNALSIPKRICNR